MIYVYYILCKCICTCLARRDDSSSFKWFCKHENMFQNLFSINNFASKTQMETLHHSCKIILNLNQNLDTFLQTKKLLGQMMNLLLNNLIYCGIPCHGKDNLQIIEFEWVNCQCFLAGPKIVLRTLEQLLHSLQCRPNW